MTARTVVHLVPHTHWDREWYLPFQSFRMRLVHLVDGLLDEMDADPRVRFTLDGQTATVEDYLEIRPENTARLARLVAEGRLAVGPWRILMDEFLVSGETLVRNLEMGMRHAAELGKTMLVGYLPDMFGHVAQMPQILRRAGIADAVVWRGVPSAIDRHVFAWTAPDGSSVRCVYLLGGYGNGREFMALPDRIGRKLEAFLRTQRSAFGDDEILAMYGEDHSFPLPGYAPLVAAFNDDQDRYTVRIETLAEYIEATRDRAIPALQWTGELRSSARANVLMGVVSHRIEVRQAAARAERLLERTAEPLLALHGGAWPGRLLEIAWRRIVDNSAHDSICACSSEETVAQVLTRFAEAEQIGRGLTEKALREIGHLVPIGAFAAVNPSPTERTDLVELELPVDRSPIGTPVTLPDGALVPT
ncbi:MAG: alpha-mannosidase, partial [Thermoplasmata archaeon]|nr:alpha-mannosidase [Thermoplasmata archaeon]